MNQPTHQPNSEGIINTDFVQAIALAIDPQMVEALPEEPVVENRMSSSLRAYLADAERVDACVDAQLALMAPVV